MNTSANTGWVGIGDYNFNKYATGWRNGGYFKNDDASAVRLKPFTDLFLYEHADFKGRVYRIHNGADRDFSLNIHQGRVNFNDTLSSYKVRAGAIDGQQTTDSNDTSGNSICDIKYQVHIAGAGWLPWVNAGQETGRQGVRIEALRFHYTGPGQMYCRAHTANIGWMNWVSSGEVSGTTGQSRQAEAFEFKIEGVDNVFFGLDVFAAGKGWMSQVGLNTVGGTTGQSRQLEKLKISCSLKTYQAVTPQRVINLVDIPKDWVITDLSIGKFEPLIGKPFFIRSRGNANFVIDTEGRQFGGGPIKIYQKVADFHPNQTWTVDKDGHLISWENRNSILYIDNSRNGYRPVIIGWKGQEHLADSTRAKWRLTDDGEIVPLYQPNQTLDIEGAKYANNTPVLLWAAHKGGNQRWDVVMVQDMNIGKLKDYVGKPFYIQSQGNGNCIIDTEGRQFGGGGIVIFDKLEDGHVNQTWTTDADGHLISWENRNSILYVENTNNGTRPIIIGWKGQEDKANSMNAKWCLNNDGQLECIASRNQILDISGGEYKAKVPIILWGKHGGPNQKWNLILAEMPPNANPDIGEFKPWINKSFVIRPASNEKMIIDTEAHHKAPKAPKDPGSWVKLYEKVEDFHPNQTWTVDQDGHIATWENRDAILYAGEHMPGRQPTLVSAKDFGKDNRAKWRFANGRIENIANSLYSLEVANTNQQTRVTLAKSNNGQQLQKWTLLEIKPCPWKGLKDVSTIGSILVGQLTEVTLYGVDTNCKEKPKKIILHNGMRWRPGKDKSRIDYKFADFKKTFGIDAIKSMDVKYIEPDNSQTDEVVEYDPEKEGFIGATTKDGKCNIFGVILVIVLSLVISFYAIMKMTGMTIGGVKISSGKLWFEKA